MSNAYSVDLRERAVAFVLNGGTRNAACTIFQIGENTLYRWLRQHRKMGHVVPKVRGKTAPRKLADAELLSYVDEHQDATLAEIGEHFAVSAVAVWKACQRLAITRKKTVLYRERNEQARRQFQKELERLEPETLGYLDESGVDASLHRPYGRAPRGTKVMGEVSGTRAHRMSLIAALNGSHLLAPMRFEGYCDTQVFNAWLEQVFLPELKPGQTVIMDNASFHKSLRTSDLITRKGCMLKFLPTYSPDLNPIEHHWAILKARLRKIMALLQSLELALDETLMAYQ